jgi:hypothetical protein
MRSRVRSTQGRPRQFCICVIGLAAILELFTITPMLSGQTIQEVRVQWTTPVLLPPGTSPQMRGQSVSDLFSVVSRQKMSGRLPRHREPELNSDKFVIVGRDSGGNILDWQVVGDPRIIRAEAPGPGGELSGRVLYRERADFLFTLPDNPEIERIDFYQPRWTGQRFDLDLIGGVSLR